jgi:hypothetical protein
MKTGPCSFHGRHLRALRSTAVPCIRGNGAGALGGTTLPDYSSAIRNGIPPQYALLLALVEACFVPILGQQRGDQGPVHYKYGAKVPC